MEQKNEIMSAYTVIFDGLDHLGPGDSTTTRNLIELISSDLPSEPRVADFGCGVGASALVLAQSLPKVHLLALDSHAPFISRLNSTANAHGLGERISAEVGDMMDPPPLQGVTGEFDLIWSESSIYNIGRTNAFNRWRLLLKPGGWLVFSDIVWHGEPAVRSEKASAFWANEYPDITTTDAILDELMTAGFKPLDPVLCGRECWSNYYEPLRERLHLLEKQGGHPKTLIDLMAELEGEIEVFDCTGNEVRLSFFLARRAFEID
jgi:SAM-dependent methyltransferase